VKTLDESTPLNVIYYPPAVWNKHVFKGEGRYNKTELHNEGSIWDYYYEPEFIYEQIDLHKPDWIGGFVEPYSKVATIIQKIADESGVKTFFFAYENLSNNFLYYPENIQANMPTIAQADLILCGNTISEKFMKTLGAKRTKVIPHTGIDTNFFRILDIKPKYEGIFLSRKVPEKGWEQINRSLNQSSFRVYTPTSFVPISQIPEFYNSGKVFVHASLRTSKWLEQLGYVIPEALSCGRSVIMSKYGSQLDWFSDAPGIVIYDPLDETSTREAFDHALSKYPNHEGREWVLKNFSNEVIANKYYDLLK